MSKTIISINSAVPRLPELRFQEPVSWTIEEGQQWAVIGPNGAGKTLLADILQKKHSLQSGEVILGFEGRMNEVVRSMAFKDIYSLADYRNAYYQQRWHSTETEDVPFVSDILAGYKDTDAWKEMAALFGIDDLLPKRLLFLSSGELRKFLIVRTLLSQPRLLILDNPFIGLDAVSRELLVDLLRQITILKKVQVILLLSNPADIPDMVTHIMPVHNKRCLQPVTRMEFMNDHALQSLLFPLLNTQNNCDDQINLPAPINEPSSHTTTLRMENVCIRYGERTILKDLNWEILNGEKWALFGPNGSGKSTLLSLVYADNPQSYANTFYLFDRKRGSGESIWDIKRRIGYVSPEMHLYYQANVPALNIVGSGFFDSIGLHRKCDPDQEVIATEWMKTFGILQHRDHLFLSLSSGEQRLVLLARAFVKDPDLLILDEPLHGLDVTNKLKVSEIINAFCSRTGKTLIYVTHYPNELPEVVSKTFVLNKIR